MKSAIYARFIHFLENDLALSNASISLAAKHHEGDFRLLPIVLWKYGLATLDEVDEMFGWLEVNEVS